MALKQQEKKDCFKSVQRTISCLRGIDEVGEEGKEVRSNRFKKVRRDRVKSTGGWAGESNQG